MDWLEQKTGIPVIGVLPYLHGFDLEAEDAINAEQVVAEKTKLNVKVPVLPRISNHTDFDTLRLNPDINLTYVGKGQRLEGADLIILPGSKSVRNDLDYLRSQGWDRQIERHLRYGGKVIGICGGYQMLGEWIHDPLAVESAAGSTPGLAFLNAHTTLASEKTLTNVSGTLTLDAHTLSISGYEIHAGITEVNGSQPITLNNNTLDGAISDCNQVFGTYLHGIFDDSRAVTAVARWVGIDTIAQVDHRQNQQHAIDRIADAIEQHLDLNKLWP